MSIAGCAPALSFWYKLLIHNASPLKVKVTSYNFDPFVKGKMFNPKIIFAHSISTGGKPRSIKQVCSFFK